jgi:hypothetical protein
MKPNKIKVSYTRTLSIIVYVTPYPAIDRNNQVLLVNVSSNEAILRHMGESTYGCFLPALTRFIDFHCTGPHFYKANLTCSNLKQAFNPAVADCGLQGTANSPSSTVCILQHTLCDLIIHG